MSLSLDATILKQLRGAEFSSADELGAPALVAERIAGLREAGYEIAEEARRGYRLISAPDRLIADDLAGLLENCALARQILVFERTASTNDVTAQLGRDGVAEGVVVFAEAQTAGRGRFGRAWDSAARAGLWFSLLLRPALPPAQWSRLSTFAAVAIARSLQSVLGQPATIKWPNDIYFGDQKAVGILVETQGGENGFAVLGIGVNVNQTEFPEALAHRAVSLRQVAGRFLDRQMIAVSILRELNALYPKLAADFDEIRAEAAARNYLRGREVEMTGPAGSVRGIAETLDENGALVLRISNGARVILSSGEASVTLSRP